MEPTLDKCPGHNLYIGGFIGLRRTKALQNCNITHIVSVLDWQFEKDAPLIRGYRHLHIPVDDVEDENLLEWFPRSNAFIEQGLNHSEPSADQKASGVYIHCAMGKSRSATVLIAYLLWASRQALHSGQGERSPAESDMVSLPPKPLSVIQALELLRRGRAIAEPNEGFMDQLHMYEDMGCPSSDEKLKSHKIYRRWMNKRAVTESLRINQAPDMLDIQFEDEGESADSGGGSETSGNGKNESAHLQEVAPGILAPDGTQPVKSTSNVTSLQKQVTLKCRKCRHSLATTPFILEHEPPPHRDPSHNNPKAHTRLNNTPLPPPQCAHIFLHPLSWMKEVLGEGKIEGRLTCPNTKCGANVGKFSWTGLRCNCGGWVTPGFGIIRAKVDEVIANPPATLAHRSATATSTGVGAASAKISPGPRGNL